MKYKKVFLSAKCSDLFCAEFVTEDGKKKEYDGCVPEMFGGGDYVALAVDLETGQILNWKPPTDEDIDELESY